MFRSAWYQDWFNAVDKTGAIYYSRQDSRIGSKPWEILRTRVPCTTKEIAQQALQQDTKTNSELYQRLTAL